MFNTAGVRFIWRVFSALSIVSLVALLGACTNPPTARLSEPKSWVVENVASKSTAELYADIIKPGVFERSSSKVINGYTVESGKLLMPDKSVGSLITVRSGDGSLTTVVEQPGNSGLLTVNSNGESRFVPFPVKDYSLPDTVKSKKKMNSNATKSSALAGPYVIDMLVGYSKSAVQAAGGDAFANALAQVESVNLALRNSHVSNVSMRLVGVQVVEQNYPISGDTLERLSAIFSTGIQHYEPDMVYGIFSGHADDTAVGWAYVPGRTAIGYIYGEAFRHEVGHNAGGGHCYESGGSYNNGFSNGKSSTAQCGNESPYYSTPAVRDQHGLPLGDSATADMARVWRENAERLSSYAVFLPKAPTGFRDIPASPGVIQFEWGQSPRAVKYEVWGQDSVLLPYKKLGESDLLNVTLSNVPSGTRPYYVVAVYADGTLSPKSNIVYAKPFQALK